MDAINLSPATAAMLTKLTQKPTVQTVQPQVTKAHPNGKKMLAFGAAAAATIAIAGIAIYASKKINPQAIAQKAQKLKEEFPVVLENMETEKNKCQGIIDEVLSLVEKAKETGFEDIKDGEKILKHFELEEIDGQKVLKSITEYDIEGIDERISEFSLIEILEEANGVVIPTLRKITSKKDNIFNEINIENNTPVEIFKGAEKLKNGAIKIAEYFNFDKYGNTYSKNILEKTNGTETIEKSYHFTPSEFNYSEKIVSNNYSEKESFAFRQDGNFAYFKNDKGYAFTEEGNLIKEFAPKDYPDVFNSDFTDDSGEYFDEFTDDFSECFDDFTETVANNVGEFFLSNIE